MKTIKAPRGAKPTANKTGRKLQSLARRKILAPARPQTFPVIAMAASVGGLAALSAILEALPKGFPGAIAIVMHLSPDHKSILAEILNRRTHLQVKEARTGDVLCPGSVFVAPPNHHLSVAPGGLLKLSSAHAKKINYARPSAEPLFISVAAVYQRSAIAVVLTGGDGDGSFGVQIIKDRGGLVIAQDRPTSVDFSMPQSSIETGDVDFILPLGEIAAKLIALVGPGQGAGDSQHSVAAVNDRRKRAATLDGGHRPPLQVRKNGMRPLKRFKPIENRYKRHKTPVLAKVVALARLRK